MSQLLEEIDFWDMPCVKISDEIWLKEYLRNRTKKLKESSQ